MQFAKFLLPTAACVAFLTISGAEAADVKFRYHAYQLSSQEGIQHLYARIQSRVRLACVSPGPRGTLQRTLDQQCKLALTDQIITSIGSAELLALHSESVPTLAQR